MEGEMDLGKRGPHPQIYIKGEEGRKVLYFSGKRKKDEGHKKVRAALIGNLPSALHASLKAG